MLNTEEIAYIVFGNYKKNSNFFFIAVVLEK